MADIPAPGGWTQGLSMKLLGVLALGSAAVGGGAGVAINNYGTRNGAQDIQYIEQPLQQVKGKGGAFAVLNPLPADASGVIVEAKVFVANNPSPVSNLFVGTATGALGYSGSNVFSTLAISNAPRLLDYTLTGASALKNVVIAPANSTGKKYITGSYGFGSGQVIGQGFAGFVRIGIINCSLQGQLHC